MLRLRITLQAAIGLLPVFVGSSVLADTPAEALKAFGLIGVWSIGKDCAQERTEFKSGDDGKVLQIANVVTPAPSGSSHGGRARYEATITSVQKQGDNQIKLTLTRPVCVHLQVTGSDELSTAFDANQKRCETFVAQAGASCPSTVTIQETFERDADGFRLMSQNSSPMCMIETHLQSGPPRMAPAEVIKDGVIRVGPNANQKTHPFSPCNP